MARPLRIEYSGVVYHVITRGNNRQAIFTDDRDRTTYLQKMGDQSSLPILQDRPSSVPDDSADVAC
jgi:REP element-mobilizing transposase RayT